MDWLHSQKKCKWGAHALEYLGHLIGKGKVSVPEGKLEAIKNFKRPNQSFLGTTCYYKHFILTIYADHSFLLMKATRKAAPLCIMWTNEIISNFQYLCSSLSHSCTLAIPLLNDCFLLQTEASRKRNVSLGSSVYKGWKGVPVAFISSLLVGQERTYSATELEFLVVKESVHHF